MNQHQFLHIITSSSPKPDPASESMSYEGRPEEDCLVFPLVFTTFDPIFPPAKAPGAEDILLRFKESELLVLAGIDDLKA
jgi:hypothetical protein